MEKQSTPKVQLNEKSNGKDKMQVMMVSYISTYQWYIITAYRKHLELIRRHF